MNIRTSLALATTAIAASSMVLLAVSTTLGKSRAPDRVFELRTYVTEPGRLDALNARFRDHTCKLFQKHGIELVGFWTPQDEKDGKKTTLIYVLAYPSREAAKASWAAFQADPEWQKARADSEKDGKILAKAPGSIYLDPTDYSPAK